MIEVKELTKTYGKNIAVSNISFVVNDGEIVGFLGPNGAGKTTTMNMMTGYISATSGSVNINGFDILREPEKAKQQIGYLPDTPPLYGEMTVDEYLKFVCDIKSVSRGERAKMLDEICETVKITDVRKRLIKNLSKGYRQRVGLAQALIGYPDVLILDEPTVGLDPKQIIEMRDIIKELGERHTVILSSHILHEVSEVCDKIIIIDKGKIVVQKDMSEFEGMTPDYFEVRFKQSKTADEILSIFSEFSPKVEGSKEIGTVDFVLKVKDGDNDFRERIFNIAFQNSLPILMFKPVKFSLEEIFMNVISNIYDEEIVSNDEQIDLEENTAEDNSDEQVDLDENDKDKIVNLEKVDLTTEDTNENEEVEE